MILIDAVVASGRAWVRSEYIDGTLSEAAAQRTDRPAATNVASFAQFAFVAFLLAPPLLGEVAQGFGVRWTY